ncbi:hypothetical protein Q8A64_00660 [Oxalobacteraceae bacterium R-40]|uniref:Pilus assembly protein n=1 Tax=Keguizhuia sedimenti TaxID=3064264 RepID=A0ABU1BIT3_9BURK|nr:hypothetical protein [Oxalobacteraceae bacterium R-40]
MAYSQKDLARHLPVLSRFALSSIVFLLSACASVTPHLDANFGESARLATAQQTMYPDASRNNDPVNGIDGRSANEAVKRYYKSFQEPPPPPSLFRVITNSGE